MVETVANKPHQIRAVNSDQMRELDRIMLHEYHIDLLMLMENAGRDLALQAKRILTGPLQGKRILVMVGNGNNGGGGLASARHLYNWGAKVEIVLSSQKRDIIEAPARQLRILEKIGIPIREDVHEIRSRIFDLIIDSLLGYNQKGDPRGRVADLVEFANATRTPILALDIPTGLDPDTGQPNNPCIKATQTLTLAIPKIGLLKDAARPFVGELFVADISVPKDLYWKFGIRPEPTFSDVILDFHLA